eukprot:TRINITY_DN3883_c0_g1_i1.p1 TRINITY_DN3883_c0_g1~~TRINITY_DN3883_c0_g1_i1.p1  ORF type:complete len:514 (-),score=116.35 TRINITY_DN3883_c0_g1_i1:111-1652(-)
MGELKAEAKEEMKSPMAKLAASSEEDKSESTSGESDEEEEDDDDELGDYEHDDHELDKEEQEESQETALTLSSSLGKEWSRWQKTHPLRPLPKLAWKLFALVAITGPGWFLSLLRLLIFGCLLLPVWVAMGWFYLTSSNMRRNLRYGKKDRNFLDLYFPEEVLSGKKCPVVIYVTGGAWVIGYKAWGSLIGKILLRYGIITVTPDYRNYPQGNIEDMLEDVEESLFWITKNITRYGGDPNQIYLVGQSAGAHICSLLLFQQAKKEWLLETTGHVSTRRLGLSELRKLASTGSVHQNLHRHETFEHEARRKRKRREQRGLKFKLDQIRAYMGISGPYDINGMREHFHTRGLPKLLLYRIFGGEKCLDYYSPLYQSIKLSSSKKKRKLFDKLPPFYLMHGKGDNTVPYASSENLFEALKTAGVDVTLRLYEYKTHTDPIIEDLLSAEVQGDDVLADVVDVVKGRPFGEGRRAPFLVREGSNYHDNFDPLNRPKSISDSSIVPRLCMRLAKLVNPF